MEMDGNLGSISNLESVAEYFLYQLKTETSGLSSQVFDILNGKLQ
jgi:hypothetical protein